MHLTALGNALFSRTQQRVLGLLFGDPARRFFTNEIVRLAAMGRGTVTRELDRLAGVGILSRTREGNQLYYQANPACPLYQELLGIMRKTSGVAGLIGDALGPLQERIAVAFVFGSVALGDESFDSPIELFIVAEDLTYGDVMLALAGVGKATGRFVDPSIYSLTQLRRELLKKNTFISRVLRQPKLWVRGDDEELRRLRDLARQ